MSYARTKALALAMALGILFLFSAETGGQQRGPAHVKPIVIRAEMAKGRVVYQVDSKPALPDLLRVLNVLEEQRGKDCPVVVLLDFRVPISEFWNIDGTAGKADLTNLRYFVFFRDTEKMVEIKWGPAVPYSTNPSIDRDPLGIR
ncbi:MAG: hypothetical protein LAN36_13115 [Acidobacteriia bacterium]|nr:hypothetical protein [Terriglobia bacterium]